MTRLSTLYGAATSIRRDRPLTLDELMRVVPGVFGDDKHTSRSARYTYIPTITVLESLQREGFEPFLPVRPACATRIAASTQNTCCACVALGKSRKRRCRKSCCLTVTMAPAATA